MWQAPTVEQMQELLPQYEIMEILGHGGMGAVYKGRQKSLKRLVAIKILPLGMADDEMKFAERFQNEAQTMAQMNHPAIVSVHDFGETPDGLLYFIMEFVDGTDVQKMIQASGKLSGEYALAITAHVCDALAYAHKRGVIHRDIKPANILIDQEGHIKVADFGLAKMHDPSQTSGLTKTNMAMGTPDYVAPEVLSPGMVADHRADIYAVGVMLYQMLTGEVPRGLFKLPSRKGIGSDPRFDDIICKAMEQDREERYQSAMDVRHALDVILTTPQPKDDGTGIVSASHIPQKPVAKQPRPPGERSQPQAEKKAAPQQAPAQKAAVAPKAKAPPKKQSPAILWLSIGGIVTVLGLASFFALGGKSEPVARVQPGSASPVDASFLAQVAAAPAAQQVELVTQKIEALNGAKVTAEPTITGEKVTGLRLARADGTEVRAPDVSPLAALKELDSLQIENLNPKDISCLRGLKLVNLTIWSGEFNDVSVLQSHPLQTLSLRQTPVSDFSMLKGKALKRLDLELCDRLSDLSFIKAMPLEYLRVPRTKVRDLSPIARLPLVELVCDPEAKLDPTLLASVPTLKKINSKPVSEWLGGSTAPPSVSPVDAAFLADVAAAPAARQVELVKQKIEALNGTTVVVEPTIKGEKVTGLRITRAGDKVRDVSPLAALKDLDSLQLEYLTVRDISCLRGLKLVNLTIWDAYFTDVSVLQSLPLQTLNLKQCQSSDFSVLKGKSLHRLDLESSVNLSDISFIKGMPLSTMNVAKSKVRDLSPIAGLPLVELFCDPEAKLDTPLIASIPTLKKINGMPVSEWLSGTRNAPPSARQVKIIDLLPLVDVKRDTITGEWSRDGADLFVKAAKPDANGTPRLQLPYQPPEEYDFEIEFTPESGTHTVFQILSAYQRSFTWLMDAQLPSGNKVGIDYLDGLPVSRRIEGTILRPKFLTNGQRYRSVVEVRRTGLRALLDGEPLVKWGSDPKSYERLDISPNQKLRDALHLGLSTYDRSVRFHKITVREITGTGKVDAGVNAAKSADSTGAAATWTEWLGPRLAKGEFHNSGFVVEKDGITTDLGMKGTNITANDTMDGAIKLTYLLRDSKGAQIGLRNRGTGPTRELYVVEDSGSGIYIGRVLGDKTTKLVSEKYPATISPTGERTLEFRAEGASLVATVNGTFTVSAHDTTLTKGPSSFVIMKGLLLKKVEIASNGVPGIGITKGGTVPAAPPSPATTWTDWLAPKLASGGFVDDGWAREAGGVTTDQPIKGIGIIRDEVKDGAVRLTGLVQGGGMQITARERNTTAVRELYVAGDTGDGLYIGRMIRYDKVVTLVRKEYPPGITRDGEHTLEFRCVGSTLTATLNGTFTITTEDSTLPQGAWTVVLRRGAVMKKVEIAD